MRNFKLKRLMLQCDFYIYNNKLLELKQLELKSILIFYVKCLLFQFFTALKMPLNGLRTSPNSIFYLRSKSIKIGMKRGN